MFRFFVIDDDATMREMVSDFVKRKYPDAQVFTFETGEAALVELHRKPEIFILDYQLDSKVAGAMNGIEVLKRIKELLPHTPILILSSQEDPQVASDTILYGAYDYIVKNENSFQRLEIMINNSTGHLSLNKMFRLQKSVNLILGILFLVVLGFVIYNRLFNN